MSLTAVQQQWRKMTPPYWMHLLGELDIPIPLDCGCSVVKTADVRGYYVFAIIHPIEGRQSYIHLYPLAFDRTRDESNEIIDQFVRDHETSCVVRFPATMRRA